MTDTFTPIKSISGKLYYPIIGLEIHAELKTASKMFCSCQNNPDEHVPNTNICAICMGHPGTLPTLNKKAIEHVIRVGVSVGSDIADYTEWDRKNYFYPDIPKGYQITQFAYPLVKGGAITVRGKDGNDHKVLLTRIHLEEDTASSSHDKGDFSLVDFNRAGLPLMELVTEPVIHDAKTAANFAKELQLLLRTLGAGDANMEKGEMRVEANISVSTDPKAFDFPYDVKTFGTKVEVKNLNSFRSVERAIDFELARHIDILERIDASVLKKDEHTERIVQETRGFDETTGKTFSQRAKEDSHDYRYFPDPDLPKLFTSEVSELSPDTIRASLPVLPWQKRAHYIGRYAMKEDDVEMFVQNAEFGLFFDTIAEDAGKLSIDAIKIAINYITSDIAGLVKKDTSPFGEIKIKPESFVELITMIVANELSSRGAKDLLALYWSEDKSERSEILNKGPRVFAEEKGMIQKNDPEAMKIVLEKVISENPVIVAEYKSGKVAVLNALVGKAMKESKGAGNPGMIQDMLKELLG